MAFPIAAYLAGFFSKRQENISNYILGTFLAISVVYLLGWFRLGLFMGGDFKKAFIVGVAPFVLIDLGKGALSILIAKRVKTAVKI